MSRTWLKWMPAAVVDALRAQMVTMAPALRG